VALGRGRSPLAGINVSRRFLRAILPGLSLVLVLAGIAWMNPRAISYFGINLMLNLAIPVALATIAQMFVITVNDLDLSIGTFVSFVACVGATWLHDNPLFGIAVLAAAVGVYAVVGAVIYLRNVPSIVVTLGMLFVWQGLAVLVLPKPGGKAPDWLHGLMNLHPPYVPFPIVAALIIAAIVHVGMMQTSYGAILRGSGGNPMAIGRAGLVTSQNEDGNVHAGRRFRCVFRAGIDRFNYVSGCEYRQRLHPVICGRCDLRRRRICRRPSLAHRSRNWRPNAYARGQPVELYAHFSRLAGRSRRSHPDHRVSRASTH